jgi:hypothetical protein
MLFVDIKDLWYYYQFTNYIKIILVAMYRLHLENTHLCKFGLSIYAFIALSNAGISLALSTIKKSKRLNIASLCWIISREKTVEIINP